MKSKSQKKGPSLWQRLRYSLLMGLVLFSLVGQAYHQYQDQKRLALIETHINSLWQWTQYFLGNMRGAHEPKQQPESEKL